jgi:hypothetical protein
MLMDGVEVLNQTEILATPEWIQIAIIVCFIAFIIGIAGCLISIIIEKEKILAFFICLLPFSFILLIAFLTISEKPAMPTGKYEYQVTIDDSVSMNEFYEKYEIIEVNGKIYTIREKE